MPRDDRTRNTPTAPPGPPQTSNATDPATQPKVGSPILDVSGLDLFYGESQALFDIHMQIQQRAITAFIGPSGCGKSTLLRCFNRLNDLVDGVRVKGEIHFHGGNIFAPEVDVNALRQRIGMVFQKSNPFPKSIYDNVAYGPRIHGTRKRADLDAVVEESLRGAALWDEVKDRLRASALGLSGGQQQRLCIARAIAVRPEVILLDEPCSALDPIATAKIEELMQELKQTYTLLIVTHALPQAARVSQFTAFMYLGKLVEYSETDKLFVQPQKEQTADYISGRFG